MIEYYKKPEVKCTINRDGFNSVVELLTLQEENIKSEYWVEVAKRLKETLFKYSRPSKDENGEIAIIDIAMYPKESAWLIELLISALGRLETDKDYTGFIKRK